MNKQWLLASRPVGNPQPANFEWQERAIPDLQEEEVCVRVLQLSLDPASRGWMMDIKSYLPPVALGAVMRGIGIGVVETSRSASLPVGTLVQGMLGWQTHCVTPASRMTPLPEIPGIPLDAYLGVLSHIGLTAYFGLLDITDPKPGETLVVSAAAGAVGSLVGQIGKIKGCRVVGIAGTDEKCDWITNTLGFDDAINYKTTQVPAGLKKACPDGIDIYFENVGGPILDAVLAQMNLHGRISVCGMISQYNATEPVPGPYNFISVIAKRLRIQGFIVLDYMDRSEECMMQMAQWIGAGKLKYRVDIVDGLNAAPDALNKLFNGSNQGKLIVKVSER
ncbi:MAG: NADP-dependent oxidoreductase [Bacteroidota bacterium]